MKCWPDVWSPSASLIGVESMASTSKHLRAVSGMWVFFLLTTIYDHYDGISSWIGAPIIATFLSLITYPLVMLLGQSLRIPRFGKFWNASWWPALTVALVSSLALLFGTMLELTEPYHDRVSDSTELRLHSAISIPAFLALFFSIAYWPRVARSSRPGAPTTGNKPLP